MTSMLLATPAWNRSRACVTSSLARPTPWLATSTSLRAAASCAMAVLTCSAIWLRCSCSCCDTLRSSGGARALGADAASGKQWNIQIETVSVRRDGGGGRQSLLRPEAVETQCRVAAFRSLLLRQLHLPLGVQERLHLRAVGIRRFQALIHLNGGGGEEADLIR